MRKKPHTPLWRGSPHLKAWNKMYEEWLTVTRERSGSDATIRSYRCECEHFFSDPHRAPEHYTREEVAAFIRKPVRRATGHMVPPSPYTQNRRLATLKSFYDFASAYLVPFHNGQRAIMSKPSPCNGLKAVRAGIRPKGLTEDELVQLFAAIPRESVKCKRDFALFSFYFWTARRRNEILRMTWGDIFDVVFIEDGMPKPGHMYRYSSKGHSRDIFTAELMPEAWEALIDYLQAAGRLEHMRPDSPLFMSTYFQPGPEKPLHWSMINVILQHYADLAGLQSGRKISVHWLRWTRAILEFEEDGESDRCLRRIQELLGHASINTTMRYLTKERKRRDVGAARLAAKLGKL